MKSVKRYDGKIEHCDNGGYVTFADYKKLEARLENAEGRERKHCKRAETAEAELERLKPGKPKCSNRTVAEPRPAVLQERCEWVWDDGDCFWQASCGGTWVFTDGSPEDNQVKFCQCCGKEVSIRDAGGEIAE